MSERTSKLKIAGLIGPVWLTLGVFFLAPLAIILVVSFLQRGTYGGLRPIEDLGQYIRSWRFLRNYARTLEPDILRISWRSLWMAVATTVLCLLISYPVAYYIAVTAPRRWRGVLLALAVVPFWTSFVVRIYAWKGILRTEGLINTGLLWTHLIHQPLDLLYNNFAVLVGLVYGELPFMILPLYASLEKLDRTLLEASADLGAGRWGTFWRVTVPQTAPGIAAGIVLVFIPAIGQFIVPDLLGGSKNMLLGNKIQDQFSSARDRPFGSALALELTVIVLAMLLAYVLYSRRRGGEEML